MTPICCAVTLSFQTVCHSERDEQNDILLVLRKAWPPTGHLGQAVEVSQRVQFRDLVIYTKEL